MSTVRSGRRWAAVCLIGMGVGLGTGTGTGTAWAADPEPEVSDEPTLDELAKFDGPKDLGLHQVILDHALSDAAGAFDAMRDHYAILKDLEELGDLDALTGLLDAFDFGFEVIDFIPLAPDEESGALDLTGEPGDGWGTDDDPFGVHAPDRTSLVSDGDGWTVTPTGPSGSGASRTYADDQGNKHHQFISYDAEGYPTSSSEHTERPDGTTHVTQDIYHDDGSVTHVESEFDKDNNMHGMSVEHIEPPAGEPKAKPEKPEKAMPREDGAGGVCPLTLEQCRRQARDRAKTPEEWLAGSIRTRPNPDESGSTNWLVIDPLDLLGQPDPSELRGNPRSGFHPIELPTTGCTPQGPDGGGIGLP
ncbi:MAG: hypothetical protein ABMB14_14260 [Myxococcota bacterium]